MKTYGPEYEAWLAGLKVGDSWTAIKPSRLNHGFGEIVTLTITGQTKKAFKVGQDSYWKTSGFCAGFGRLRPPADAPELAELRAKAKLYSIRENLARMQWNDLDLATLTAIEELLNKGKVG